MYITMDYKGIEFDIEFDYQPEEKTIMYDSDGSGHQGCPEMVEQITSFEHKGTCFMEWIEKEYDEVCEKILDKIRN